MALFLDTSWVAIYSVARMRRRLHASPTLSFERGRRAPPQL